MARWLVGVDEAGRGPLAGPVAVGVVAVPKQFHIWNCFPGLNDSKKLSPVRREEVYEMLIELQKAGELRFCVRYSHAATIDRRGISRAVEAAVHRGVRAVAPAPRGVSVLLDGLLHAPREYQQQTIIGGDEREPLIMLASIAAKVRRDRLMRRLARAYPHYRFDIHKGYGTAAHCKTIKRWGLCAAHRKTFCKSFV